MSEEIQKVPHPGHPNRCQNVSPGYGQCLNLAMPGDKMCKAHISSRANNINRERKRLYDLQKFKDRMDDMFNSSDFRTLLEELALARILLETIFKATEGDANLLTINASKISDLISKIQKLVEATHKIERISGNLLDKNALMQLAGNIINIITTHVDDPEIIGKISEGILEEIKKTQPHNLE